MEPIGYIQGIINKMQLYLDKRWIVRLVEPAGPIEYELMIIAVKGILK